MKTTELEKAMTQMERAAHNLMLAEVFAQEGSPKQQYGDAEFLVRVALSIAREGRSHYNRAAIIAVLDRANCPLRPIA